MPISQMISQRSAADQPAITNKNIRTEEQKKESGQTSFEDHLTAPAADGPGQTGPATKSTSRFEKPSLDQVRAYAAEIGIEPEAERFLDHYESNGWRVGANPMKDWRAAMRYWKSNRRPHQTPSQTALPRHTTGRLDNLWT